ncbi:hypothetical protein GCM10009565_62350 [Amycolatopsis albidoflavus]
MVERDIMVSAYALRKLKESRKLSDAMDVKRVTVLRHELTGRVPDVWDRHQIWESYNLEGGTEVVIGLSELCNQIVHSWVWVLSADELTGLFDGVFVSSDRERKKYLYFIPLGVLISLFRDAGEEDVHTIIMERDKNGNMHFIEKIAD